MPSSASNLNKAAALAAAITFLLSACAELPAPPEAPASSTRFVSVEAIGAFRLTGRIAVKHEGQGFSGTLRWEHDARRDEVLLQSPLGQGVARIVRDAGGVTLTDADDKVYRAATAEALTREVLGWQLPLDGLEHWVLGRAAPESAARLIAGDDGRLARLIQDGWQVDFERYQAVQGAMLPGRLEAAYGNDMTVRLVIDRWVLE
jgi:outer membrane lipoprotein LolB